MSAFKTYFLLYYLLYEQIEIKLQEICYCLKPLISTTSFIIYY